MGTSAGNWASLLCITGNSVLYIYSVEKSNGGKITCTAIPYRARTGPEQGFPGVVFPHRENPVSISWDPCNEKRFFPVGNNTQAKP